MILALDRQCQYQARKHQMDLYDPFDAKGFCRGLKGPTEEALIIELVFVLDVIGMNSLCRRDHLPNGGK